MDNVDSAVAPVSSTSTLRFNLLALIIVGIVMFLIGLGGGYVLFSNKNEKVSQGITQIRQDVSTDSQTSEQLHPSMEQRIVTIVPTLTITFTTKSGVQGGIGFTLPPTWESKISASQRMLKPKNGGGFLAIKTYDYPDTMGRREYYCQVSQVCIEGTTNFTEVKIGNISGYLATALDNSGGGPEYFGSKGNKFYIIGTYNPPSPNDFENNYQIVLDSLVF